MTTSMLHVRDFSIVEYDSTTGTFTITFGRDEGQSFKMGVIGEMPQMTNGTERKTDTTVSFFTPNTAVFGRYQLVFFQMGI
jgi:hypothetical protein